MSEISPEVFKWAVVIVIGLVLFAVMRIFSTRNEDGTKDYTRQIEEAKARREHEANVKAQEEALAKAMAEAKRALSEAEEKRK